MVGLVMIMRIIQNHPKVIGKVPLSMINGKFYMIIQEIMTPV